MEPQTSAAAAGGGKSPPSPSTSTEHVDAAAAAVDRVTSEAGGVPVADPKTHLHRPAGHESAHALLRSMLPPHVRLEEFESRWHLGNYVVVDRATGAREFEPMPLYVRLGMHLLYYGSAQERALHWKRTQEALRAQSVKMGRQYDAPASAAHIEPFIASFGLAPSLPELLEPDPAAYPTFNAFFSRRLRPGARPVAPDPDDDDDGARVVSSVADCRLAAFPSVALATRCWIKGRGFTVARLLGVEDGGHGDGDDVDVHDEEEADAARRLARSFDGGAVAVHRLAPQDYHRWHAPCDGTVEWVRDVPGTYYTVNPQAVNEEGAVDVFCENKRSIMLLSDPTTPGRPLAAIVAVGAMLVGSIAYSEDWKPGDRVRRGQELGAFLYGGSTVVVLFPPAAGVVLDEDLVGWRIGTMRPKS
ncbi:phosphatidylserine decarboxylase-domain-containing protein [Xylariaceae sp. FL0804]|nr:phosphatidylserine decarboxylase-domain-containing protein [Xylariaceae sp. FL0804]